MIKWTLLLILISCNAIALEAVVTVLETPLFKYRSYEAPVVQYLRKGDVIKIHPSVGNDPTINEYSPSPEKMTSLKEEIKARKEFQDPLFKGDDQNTAYLEDEFIPTLDRQGHVAYVLSEHIYVYFNNSREFEQKISSKDPTDYRLEEPLPKNYPLKTLTGLRGQFIMGINQPYYESYNYRQDIKTKGYSSPLDLSYTILKQAPGDYQERLFIGGSLNLKHFKNSYLFQDNRISKEEGIKFGLGPTISYDAFKDEKNRINLSGTITLNIFNRIYIKQSLQETKDSRYYSGNSIAPKISIQYQRKNVLSEFDFILGTSIEAESPTTFKAKNAGKMQDWWQDLGNDEFTTRTTFALGAFAGLQKTY